MKYSFPINKNTINHYPNIKKAFRKDLSKDFSSKQIFRLLDNLHYDRIKALVEFFEMYLSKDEFCQFVTQKLNTNEFTTFSNNIKEIFLLDFLLKKGFNIYTFDNNKTNRPVPEYYINNSSSEMLIELYSPLELYGFEKFFNELQTAIKYFPNNLGFNCIMEIKFDKKEDEWIKRAIIPSELNDKYSNDKLRHKEIDNIVDSILNNSDGKQRKRKYYLTDDIYISTSIKFKGNCNNRWITYSSPSYDSLRDYVSIQKNSKGFYKKLLHKIKSGQLNKKEYPSVLKVLFVDFSHSMGSEVLVEGMGEDFLSKIFYENLSQRLKEDASVKNVDLLFPIICGMNDNFVIGKCVFNPKNINIQNVFSAS